MEDTLLWLKEETSVLDHPTAPNVLVGTYEFDGIKLYKPNVDARAGGLNQLLIDMYEATLRRTGFYIRWLSKPMDKLHNISSELAEVEAMDKELAERSKPNASLKKYANRCFVRLKEMIMEWLN